MTMLRAFLSFMLVASTSAVYNIQGHLVCTGHAPPDKIAADDAVDDVWVQLYYMDHDTVQTYCTPFKIGGDDLRQTEKMVRKGVSRGIRCINECILYDKYHDGDAIRSVAFFHDKNADRHCYCGKAEDRGTSGAMSTCLFKHRNDYLDLIRAKHDSRVSRNGKQMISLNNNDNFIHLEGAAGRTDNALMLMVKVTNSKCDGDRTTEEEGKPLKTNKKYDGFVRSANFITMGQSTFGVWKEEKLICKDGVRGFRLKVDSEPTGSDGTGLNGIRLKCMPYFDTGELKAQWGTWKTYQICNPGTHVVSFQLRGEGNTGTVDKAAAHNVRMRCGDGIELDGGGRLDGHWEPYKSCPGRSYFCGVQVSIQPPQSRYRGDNTALNQIRFYCCTASFRDGDVDLKRAILVGEITVTGESGVEVPEKKMTIHTRTDTGMWIECNSFTHSGNSAITRRCRKRTVARYVRIAPDNDETLSFTVKVTKAKPSMAFRKPAKQDNDVQQVTTYSHDADKAVDGIYDSTYAEAYEHWSVDLKELITIDKIIIYLARSFYSGREYHRISQLKVQTNRWNLDTWTPCNDAQATECVRNEPKSDLSTYPDIFRKDNNNGNDIFRKEETCDSGTMARAVRINNNCGVKMHLYEVEVLEANVVWFDTPYNCFDDLTPQFGCKNLKFDLATGEVTKPSGSIDRQTHEEAEAEGTESLVRGEPESLFGRRGERELKKTLIKIVNVGKEYILKFHVKRPITQGKVVWFLHGNLIDADGDGGPTVYWNIRHNTFKIYSFINGNNVPYETRALRLRQWVTVEVRQLVEEGQYKRSIIINGELLDTVINNSPTESKQVKIYASGHIRQLAFGKPDPSSLFNTIELARDERRLVENTLIKTVHVGKEYILKFQVKLFHCRYGNIVLFSRNQISERNYGDGGPAVFFESSCTFTIHSFLSGQKATYVTTEAYQLHQWITIEVRQLLEGRQYMRSIIINDVLLNTANNNNPIEVKGVKVYASKQFGSAAHNYPFGHIRSLTFGKPVYYKIWSRMLNTPLYPGHGSSHEWLERSKYKTLARVHNSEITIEETFIRSNPDVLFWKLEKVETIDGKDYYKIINKDTGGAILDKKTAAAEVEKKGNNWKDDDQLWKIVKTDDAYYTFVSKWDPSPLYAEDYNTKVGHYRHYRSTGRDLWGLQKITPTL